MIIQTSKTERQKEGREREREREGRRKKYPRTAGKVTHTF
jgi:hypothetical protein